jgi:uncharacterized membrane protein YbhN (UPF0104 family)
VVTSQTRSPPPPALAAPEDDWRHGLPARRRARRRRALVAGVFLLVAAGAVLLLARVGQLEQALRRLEHTSPGLLGLAAGFEVLSFAGYVAVTRIVFEPVSARISWRASLEITLAGVVATRLVTAGGAGGIALTAWALRAAGLDARTVATRVAAFLAVVYAVFFGALALGGASLATGTLGGGAVPRALALVGAGIGVVVVGLGLALLLVPFDLEDRAGRWADPRGRLQRLTAATAPMAATAREAVALALSIARERPAAVAGALAWWGFDVAVLWSTFEMFGGPPPLSVLVLCYFLGHAAQVIPVPGGVGPVEGGMIASFAACGVPVALALVAVLTYQAISTWLPAAPGAWAYLRLRRTVAAWREAA